MSEYTRRPKAVSVIGYAAIALGILWLGGGLTLARDSRDMLERAIAAVQMTLGLLLVSSGWALLQLRRWGSLMIQAVGILFLVCLVLFELVFLSGAFHFASVGMPGGRMMIVVGVAVMVLYAIPLLLTVRTLRKASVCGLLT